jgi:transposase-like protein
MIIIKETKACRKCGSINIVKNGKTQADKQKYHCKDCQAYGSLELEEGYSPQRKAEILRAYQERSSLRGLTRTFGVARQTVAKWLAEEAQQLPDQLPLEPAEPDDVLELDEVWSFVGSKKTSAGSG